ncbi:GNAT family N-acetyltransferase [Trinickia caryophylli]|uniref:L-amino acid N-acyltransferase YncA n=1 Tax=Trinickia caryophylli TaxID=28094 RepID=A0A1X7DU02_TRICW|nr:GNAT family N-acetyltransferase [Trinickia caryophylli]PMS09190.1 N-acetyltransferase [Trinickia caryophylli]WQE11210.1 GNAT family N-acetyltransferase [Trinickia caryophylli]GLU32355.1 N-acetyltransferase [Trinickia caryophylli]SMF21796.1 L-amino acid N-acyltransferase YncA [Trinickia caryophylli]
MTDAIRAAEPRDVPAMLGLMLELAEYEKLTHLFVATEDSLRDALFGTRPAAEALVAERDGSIVGYALFFHNFSTFLSRRGLYLEDIYVQPAIRGGGLGTALLRRVAEIALERQCGRFEWSVLDWNQPAIDFYTKLGATVMPDWRIVRVTDEALRRLAQGG